jgi:asparagine synthase (glutamine-hydrolysing)
MHCGIEIRSPFLSQKLVKFANALEFSDKFGKNTKTTKLILKLMAEERKLIPNKNIKSEKKGFHSDVEDWIREDKLKVNLKDMVKDKKGFFNGYLDGTNANQIIDLHFDGKKRLDTLVWSMLTLEIWHRLCGEGDVNFFENYEISY